MNIKKVITYLLIAFVVVVFLQSLPFKFQILESEETAIIFSTIAAWMSSIGLGFIAPAFEAYGGFAVGVTELIASILIILPKTRRIGAFIGAGVISGAIFFHLFTPLGVDRVINSAGDTDGGALFFMACGVLISCIAIFFLSKKEN